jgi:selenium-binding protein 1
MAAWRPDPTFYPSPRLAAQAPPERLAYVATMNPVAAYPNGDAGSEAVRRPDALVVADVDSRSPTYGQAVGRADMPHTGDEFHHFGWNACSSALCPSAPHPHVERRHLIVPGLRSSRIHVLDTRPDPRRPRLVKTIEPEEVARRAGYSRLHTVHCGPEGIYVGALGSPDGEGPGGVLLLDHDSFEVLGRWEVDRGPQYLAYDFAWHLGYDTMVTSEWGTPKMVEGGIVPDLLLNGKYGHALQVWDLRQRRHRQTLDLGPEQQIALELRPAHDPTRPYGFANVVVSTEDLSASVWLWHHESVVPDGDDRPRQTGAVRLGGIVARAPHPTAGPLNGGPQMVELSRDGRRVYLTNSLYASWDAQFYPDGIKGWMAKLDVDPNGGMRPDENFLLRFDGERPHQVRLDGGDASSDSYCFP